MEARTLNASQNITSNQTRFEYSVEGKLVKTLACTLLLFISAFGNSFIIWTVYKDNRLKTTTNYLVANMAVSDIVVTVVAVPVQIVETNFNYQWFVDGKIGLFLCKFVMVLYNVCAGVSVYTAVFIALDRYFAVTFPMQCGFRRSKLKHILPGVWLIALIIILPFQDDIKLERADDNNYCLFHSSNKSRYINLMLLIGLPFLMVAIIYSLIVFRMHQHKLPGQQTDFLRRKRDRQNRNVLRMSIVIISSLYTSWIFYSVVMVLAVQKQLHNLPKDIATNLVYVANFMIQLFFSYNFFIYLVFNTVYRNNFKTLFRKILNYIFPYAKRKKKSLEHLRMVDLQPSVGFDNNI